MCNTPHTPKANAERYGVATMSRFLKNYRSLLQNIVSFIGLSRARLREANAERYGVATISSFLKIIGLFCRI